MQFHYQTDRGKVRSLNEDASGTFSNDFGHVVAVVADGMGGHLAGEVASQMLLATFEEKFNDILHNVTPMEVEEWLRSTILESNNRILQYGKDHEECEGMGTTVVATFCTREFMTVAHVGDSRAYYFNGTLLSRLTDDHTLVNALVKNGQITLEEAEHHPRKHMLTQAIGTETKVNVDIRTLEWEEGECVLLCSDGLSNKVHEQQIEQYMMQSESIQQLAEALIHSANENGGEDNITLAIVLHDFEEKGEATC